MSLNAEICRLLERAKPLRRLPADEAEDAGLGKLVEEINALRKVEADAEHEAALASIKANLGPAPEWVDSYSPSLELSQAVERVPAQLPEKRKPGRPKKAD